MPLCLAIVITRWLHEAAMATGKVTKRSVDAMAVTGRNEYLWDDELRGFGVRMSAGGVRAYVVQYRMGGREAKTKRFTIGQHGSWTPEQARTEAKRLLRLVDQGSDPASADRERRRQAVDLAFSSYVDLFAERYLKSSWKRWEATKALLIREAVPVLRDKPLPLVTRADINVIYDALSDRPATAKLMHATLRKLFRWALGRGDIERTPFDGITTPKGAQARDRVLDDRELKFAWTAAGGLGAPFDGLYRALILTGQRREEVAGLDWRELDREGAMWTLPRERAKNGEAHLVPLSEAGIELFDGIAGGAKWPKQGLVFSTTGKTAPSGFSKAKARLDAAMVALAKKEDPAAAIAPWVVHDFRRTVATGLQILGVRFEVTEAVLNHRSGSKSGIAGVYQRHDWKAEKREALNAWAVHLKAITT